MNVPFNDLSRSETMSESFFVRLEEMIRSGQYISGPHTKKFEQSLAEYIGVPYVKAVSSGTSALVLALKSLDLPEKSNVLITANSGGYARIAAEMANLNSVYVDVGLEGLLTLRDLENVTAENVRALIVTHLYGQMAEIEEIHAFCGRNQIYLVEDCAQSLGANRNQKFAGSWGDVSAFSFYPTKNLGAMGDAGAVATSSKTLYETLQKLSQYGWGAKYSIEIKGGENSRMDEIQAFILSERLLRLDLLNERRRQIWRRYNQAFKGSPYRLIGQMTEAFVAHLAVVDAKNDRDAFRSFLHSKDIQTAIHYPIPDHRQRGFLDEPLSLPNTEYLGRSAFSLPLFPELTEEEVEYLCTSVSEFVNCLANGEDFGE